MSFLFLFIRFNSFGMQKTCILVHFFVIGGNMIYILIVIRWYVSEGEFLGIIVRYWVYYVPYLVVYKLEYFEYMAFSS